MTDNGLVDDILFQVLNKSREGSFNIPSRQSTPSSALSQNQGSIHRRRSPRKKHLSPLSSPVRIQNCQNINEDEDDIYGGLDSPVFKRQGSVSPRKVHDTIHSDALLKEIEELKRENKKLKRENKNYATNISSLYKTAKNEIDKKNFIISKLQTRLQEAVTDQAHKMLKNKTTVQEVLQECQNAYNESHSQITVDKLLEAAQQLNDRSKETGNKKQYTFGNMSIYFFKSQADFGRQEKATVVGIEKNPNPRPPSQPQSQERVTAEKAKTSSRPQPSEKTKYNPRDRQQQRPSPVTLSVKDNKEREREERQIISPVNDRGRDRDNDKRRRPSSSQGLERDRDPRDRRRAVPVPERERDRHRAQPAKRRRV